MPGLLSNRTLSRKLLSGVAGVALGQIVYAATSPGTSYRLCDGSAISYPAGFPRASTKALASPTAATNTSGKTLTDVAYGAGLFVSISSGTASIAQSSPTGAAWTSRLTSASLAGRIFYDGGNLGFCALGGASGQPSQTSLDGLTWTTKTAPASVCTAAAYGGGVYVAVNSSGAIYTSPDFSTWTARTSPVTSALNDVIWDGTRFIAVGEGGVILTYPTGVNWTAITTYSGLGGGAAGKPSFVRVAYGNGRYALLSTSNVTGVFVTTDLAAFVAGPLPTSTASILSFAGGTFLIGGTGGLVYTASNALDWLLSPFASTGSPIAGFAANGATLVAVGGATTTNPIFYTTTSDALLLPSLNGKVANDNSTTLFPYMRVA